MKTNNLFLTTTICISLLITHLSTKAQIVSNNCYKITIGITNLDYNSTLDANYIYGRDNTADEKTTLFKISIAPAPNASFYTIKTYDGKYLTREASTNKIKVKNAFDDVDNQVFDLQLTPNGINIFCKNTDFGESSMQWENNEIAYVKGKNGYKICRYSEITCLTESSGNGAGANSNSSWPSASIGIDNIINPNKGGVIIGTGVTSAPNGYKLYVEGGILTEKFVVTPKNSRNWADFVFDKEYKLMSLIELKKYIEEHKHLPDILPAKEIAKQGINIAENLVVQLQKIEELTLYIIKQDEEIKKLIDGLQRIDAAKNLNVEK